MPAFPQNFTSTISHWQATNRGPSSLWNHGRSDPLPKEADIVIVGAGATGSALAYHLTRPGVADGKSVVILDAKDVASCASGRNGGHIGPHGWGFIDTITKPLNEGGAGISEADAVDILFFEHDNLDYCEEVVKKEGIDAEFWRGERIEVATTPEGAKAARDSLKMWNKAVDKTRHRGREVKWAHIDNVEEARKVSRIPSALSVNRVPSGSWHPHRGVTGLLRRALESKTASCQFFSWAPVASLKPAGDGWVVDCAGRGTIKAKQVVLATNAYTRHLFPQDLKQDTGIAHHLVPYRGHAGLVTPPVTYAGANALQATYGIERGPYLIQAPYAGIVLGPFNATVLSQFGTERDLFYIEDDSVVVPKFRQWLGTWCRLNYEGWGAEGENEGLSRAWSGIMCHSIDWMPLIGAVPDQPGLFMSAGYNGHGMATIVSATRCLAQQLVTGKWDERLPKCFEITKERLKRAEQKCPPLVPARSKM